MRWASRDGVGLAELVLVAWLFALILLALAGFAAGQSRLAELTRQQERALDLERTAAIVLGRELRYLSDDDVEQLDGHRIRLRAFRGGGHVCAREPGSVTVAYAGVRQPDPRKDSVLWVSSTGGGKAGPLRAARVDTLANCPGAVRLSIPRDSGPAPVYVMTFESGEYHLSDGALRYRVGRGGRQPVTEAVLESASLRQDSASPGWAVDLTLHPDSLPLVSGRSRTLRIRRPGPRPPTP